MWVTPRKGPQAEILKGETLRCAVGRAAFTFAGAMLYGILCWVLVGKPLLPTISDTWAIAPASYASRYLVGTGCLVFQVANLAIYRANQDTGPHAKASWVNKLCLVLSVVAIFCLSWVGAICDSTKDSCRGDNSIHLAFAYTFFGTYNAYMIILTVMAHKQGVHNTRASRFSLLSLWTSVVTSLVTKARIIPSGFDFSTGALTDANTSFLADGGNQDIVAFIEWTDVLVIIMWTTTYVRLRAPNFGIATVSLADGGGRNGAPIMAAAKTSLTKSVTVLNRVSGFTLVMLASLLVTILLLATFVIGVFVTKDVPLPTIFGGNASWPTQSSLWESAPGNWLARWVLVVAGYLLVAYNTLALRTLQRQSCFSCFGAVLGNLGCIALAFAGCVSAYEDEDMHNFLMAIAFFGMNIFAVIITVIQLADKDTSKSRKVMFGILGVLVFISLFCTNNDNLNVQFLYSGNSSQDDVTLDVSTDTTTNDPIADAELDVKVASMESLVQWFNTFLLLVFVVFYTYVRLPQFNKLGLAIIYTAPASNSLKGLTRTSTRSSVPLPKEMAYSKTTAPVAAVTYASVVDEAGDKVATACLVADDQDEGGKY